MNKMQLENDQTYAGAGATMARRRSATGSGMKR